MSTKSRPDNYGGDRQKRRAALTMACDERRVRLCGEENSRERKVTNVKELGKNEEKFYRKRKKETARSNASSENSDDNSYSP